jgi:predicted solute-binding protein
MFSRKIIIFVRVAKKNRKLMILYNVTVKIDLDVHDDWLNWMQEVHIPDLMQTGLFERHSISKVLLQDDSDGITYAVQYACKDMATLQKYMAQHAPRLQNDHNERYKDKYVAFRTILEEL